MEIIKTENGTSVTLEVKGRVDTNTAPELEQKIQECASFDSIVMDFKDLEYISSAGLRILLSTHKNFSKKSGMVVKNTNQIVMEIFEVTGFKDVLNIE